jgi:hypothetical protein
MLIYLDMCCLKRPFDDQSQPRIRLESEAVLGLLAVECDELRFVRSPALMLENSQNPVKERALRVDQWLMAEPFCRLDADAMVSRTAELISLGFKNFDALHLAVAEQAGADVFACCDDRLLGVASRNCGGIKVRVVEIVELAKELLK